MWTPVKLKDLFHIGSSKRVLKSQWQDSGIPFYRGREITKLSKEGFVNNKLFISEELYSELSNKSGAPKAGDIVITAIGTIGNSYIVRDKDKFYFKDASVLWLKKTAEVSSEFVNIWLKSSLLKSQLDTGNGATVDTLTIKKLQGVVINLPPLEIQKLIVAKLDQAFTDIEKTKVNAKQNLHNVKEIFDNHLQGIFRTSNEGWRSTVLGELCEKMEYGTSSKSLTEGNTPVLRMGNLQKGKLDWNNLKYSDDGDEIEKYGLKTGDVLFNRTNSAEHVGKAAIYDGKQPAIFAGYLIRIHRKKDLLDSTFLNYYLNSKFARDYGKTVMSQSVNQANINGTKLKQYPISVPSLSEQQIIVEKISSLDSEVLKLKDIYINKLHALEELKQCILHKAFNGELV